MGTGMGGQSVEDMERVIAAMRRVVERLQVENETLKKQSGKPRPHGELTKENRYLKVSLTKPCQLVSFDMHVFFKACIPSEIGVEFKT